MNRSRTAFVASLAVLLPFAASAQAQPNVSVQGDTAHFSDDGGSFNTDKLSVTKVPGAGGSVGYRFVNSGAMLFGPGCLPNDFPTNKDVTCNVPSGAGVVIDVGGAPSNADQTVTLGGTGWEGQQNSITGGPGGDQLTGNGGDDTFSGGPGSDEFEGAGGLDTVDYTGVTAAVGAQIDSSPDSGTGCPSTTCENDTIFSSIENLTGGDGNDVLVGDGDPNVLRGGAGNDTLRGGAESDNLIGDAGDDTMIGGAGEDYINLVGAGEGTATGTGGTDTIAFNDGDPQHAGGIEINLQTRQQKAKNVREDRFTGVANVIGTDAADTITGDNRANNLSALGGNDVLAGEDGSASGTAGDAVSGGAGTDLFHYDDGVHAAGVNVTLDDKPDDGLRPASSNPLQSTAAEGDNIGADVENLIATAGNDLVAGSIAKNVFDGGGGSDVGSFRGRQGGVVASLGGGGPENDIFNNFESLEGGEGDDTLIGDDLAQDIYGGGGNDILRGGLGKDGLHGGTGLDTADYDDGQHLQGVVVDLNAGTQKLTGNNDSEVEDGTFESIESVQGTPKNDILTGDGNTNGLVGLGGLDTLKGQAGDDVLDPGTGADGGSDGFGDIVQGGNGTDTVLYRDRTSKVTVTPDGVADDGADGEKDQVFANVENVVGGSGDDTITADAASTHLIVNNRFDGGAGKDTLTGLGGDDTLIGGDGEDTVTGDDGNDLLQLVDTKKDSGSCGAGNDSVEADEGIDDIAADCENVKRVAVPATPAPPEPSVVRIDNPSLTEGNTGTKSLTFTVKLSAAQGDAVGVPYQTADLTAKAGEDYVAESGTLTFVAGQTVKRITVTINGDKKVERGEQFALNLGTPTGRATLGAPPTGVGTIVNDDGLKKKTPGLSAKVTPRRDRRAPYAFVVTGKLKLPKGVAKGRGCSGKVRVQAKGARGKVLRTRSGFVDATCNYTVPIRLSTRRGLPSSGRVRFVARYLGNAVLKAKTAKTASARAG